MKCFLVAILFKIPDLKLSKVGENFKSVSAYNIKETGAV
jgi:hypothetical protein